MNMNCKDIDRNLDDFLDQQLSEQEISEFKHHLSHCEECAQKVDRARLLMGELKSLAVPLPGAGFEHRVFEKVREQYVNPRQHHRFRFAAGFATAALAGLVLWLVNGLFFVNPPMDQPAMIRLAQHDVQTVNLVIDSDQAFEQVRLSIALPEHAELQGYPGMRTLDWVTNLHQGQNILALPVRALGMGQGELVAQLTYGEKVTTFRVVVVMTANEVMQHRLQMIGLV